MPAIVRRTHFIETASSNFIFGLIAAALLLWRSKYSFAQKDLRNG